MSENGMKSGMLNIIMMEIHRKDCNVDGVSYAIKDKFLLDRNNCLYLIAIVRDRFGTDTRYSYSVVNLNNGYVLVLNKDSEEYKEIVKDLPDCCKFKYTSSEPFRRWKYESIFEDLVDSVMKDNYLSKENKNIYIDYLYQMGKIKDKELYDSFLRLFDNKDLYDYLMG